MSGYRILGAAAFCTKPNAQISPIDAGLAIEQRAGITAATAKWW